SSDLLPSLLTNKRRKRERRGFLKGTDFGERRGICASGFAGFARCRDHFPLPVVSQCADFDRRASSPPIPQVEAPIMVFPIGDDNSARRRFPFVTWLLIAINVAVFFLELQQGEAFIRDWAFIPVEFQDDPGGELPTLLTAMFMHGGWLHLFGN